MLETLTDNEISVSFLALFILLLFSFIGGKLCEIIKAPKVVGEICGGMLLGGSCMAYFFPELIQSIFCNFSEEGKMLNIFYQLGLVFLMFSSGYSTTIEISKKNAKNYILLFIGATVIPFVLGIPFVGLFENHFIGTANNNTAFLIVFLISAAITSIPVISKIFFDIGMMNTKFSNMVLTVSTIQDLCLWIALNLAIHLTETGKFEIWSFLWTTVLTIGLLILAKIIEIIVKKYKLTIKKEKMPISILTKMREIPPLQTHSVKWRDE